MAFFGQDSHVTNIYHKLGVSGRRRATRQAQQSGILP